MKQGEFLLKLDEDELILRATPYALRTIVTKHGGLRNAHQKIMMIEFDIMEDLIVAGLTVGDKKPDINIETLRNNIFSAGIINLIVPMTDYLNLLGNGGKHPPAKSDDMEEDNQGKA